MCRDHQSTQLADNRDLGQISGNSKLFRPIILPEEFLTLHPKTGGILLRDTSYNYIHSYIAIGNVFRQPVSTQ